MNAGIVKFRQLSLTQFSQYFTIGYTFWSKLFIRVNNPLAKPVDYLLLDLEGLLKIVYETVEKPASERLMENVHPAGFAAGRNPEE